MKMACGRRSADHRPFVERRRRDLNPRLAFTNSSFQDWCNRPLCHASSCARRSAARAQDILACARRSSEPPPRGGRFGLEDGQAARSCCMACWTSAMSDCLVAARDRASV